MAELAPETVSSSASMNGLSPHRAARPRVGAHAPRAVRNDASVAATLELRPGKSGPRAAASFHRSAPTLQIGFSSFPARPVPRRRKRRCAAASGAPSATPATAPRRSSAANGWVVPDRVPCGRRRADGACLGQLFSACEKPRPAQRRSPSRRTSFTALLFAGDIPSRFTLDARRLQRQIGNDAGTRAAFPLAVGPGVEPAKAPGGRIVA